MNRLPGYFGIALITLAALNVVAALTGDTCNQGDAGRLFGAVFSLILYAPGFGLLVRAPPTWRGFCLLIPAFLVAVWQSVFAMRLFIGYFVFGSSACNILEGEEHYQMDGSEPFFAWLWLFMSAAVVFGFYAAFRRASR